MAGDKNLISKQGLEIIQVQEPKAYGGGQKFLTPVTAKNLSLPQGDPMFGKPIKFVVFNPDLQSYVKSMETGVHIVADIEEHLRPDSQYGPDRNIVQIYDGGKPVSQKQGGGGGWKGRSLEDDIALENVKRRSIEGQTAISQVGEFLREPQALTRTLTEEQMTRILAKYWLAVEKSLDNFLADTPKTNAPKPTAASAPRPDQRPPAAQGRAPEGKAGGNIEEPIIDPVLHIGDLLTRANKIGVNPGEVAIVCKVTVPNQITDLNAAWVKIQAHAKEKADPNDPDRLFSTAAAK